jgi:hypothetical protein
MTAADVADFFLSPFGCLAVVLVAVVFYTAWNDV